MLRNSPITGRLARGFSLIELLITLAVIATLSAMMFPAFGKVHDMARRLMCQNNMRSMFMALEAFSNDQRQDVRSSYPGSSYITQANERTNTSATCRPQQFMALTTDTPVRRNGVDRLEWDGLGKLWAGAGRYISDASTFYCPAHTSHHTLAKYAKAFDTRATASATETVYGNYHYWAAWNRAAQARQAPSRATSAVGVIHDVLLTDGLRTSLDLSHRKTGCNALKGDGSIEWIGGTPFDLAIRELKPNQTELPAVDQARIFGTLVAQFNQGTR